MGLPPLSPSTARALLCPLCAGEELELGRPVAWEVDSGVPGAEESAQVRAERLPVGEFCVPLMSERHILVVDVSSAVGVDSGG